MINHLSLPARKTQHVCGGLARNEKRQVPPVTHRLKAHFMARDATRHGTMIEVILSAGR